MYERSGVGAHPYLRVFHAEVLNGFLLGHIRYFKGLSRSVLFQEICIWIIYFFSHNIKLSTLFGTKSSVVRQLCVGRLIVEIIAVLIYRMSIKSFPDYKH
jgi:hypothetical protein